MSTWQQCFFHLVANRSQVDEHTCLVNKVHRSRAVRYFRARHLRTVLGGIHTSPRCARCVGTNLVSGVRFHRFSETGIRDHLRGIKKNTETRAPTVGALNSVFFFETFFGIQNRALFLPLAVVTPPRIWTGTSVVTYRYQIRFDLHRVNSCFSTSPDSAEVFKWVLLQEVTT